MPPLALRSSAPVHIEGKFRYMCNMHKPYSSYIIGWNDRAPTDHRKHKQKDHYNLSQEESSSNTIIIILYLCSYIVLRI